MIPRLGRQYELQPLYLEFLKTLAGTSFAGEIQSDLGRRVVTATDNSVYEVMPQAVVYPRHAEDVVTLCTLAGQATYRQIRLSARGGGTGTNGQSLCDGVIVDVSRHMNRIESLDLKGQTVTVEPGVVLDQLNAYLEPHGVFFAPHLSPSNRATIGGMISTDACGKGSRIYGRTSQHIVALDTVLLGGDKLTSTRLGAQALQSMTERNDRTGDIYQRVNDIIVTNREAIAEKFPKLKRFMTGYNLARITDEASDSFDLNMLLAGSEGTLGMLTRATLRVTPIPVSKALIVVKYNRFEDALASAEQLVEFNPSAIETIDETVLSLARSNPIYHRVGKYLQSPEGHETRAINLVEFESDAVSKVAEQVDEVLALIKTHADEDGAPFAALKAPDAQAAADLWELRKKGVGLLGSTPGARKPVAFVEDTVVPPDRLVEYVAEFRKILDAEGLNYGMFGHIDVGCLHVRPALDLTCPEDEARLHRISDKVAELVQSYGGLIWGEHGKGFRSEYNPTFFGPELYDACCEVKRTFDPHNQLNPGKIAVSPEAPGKLATIRAPTRGSKDARVAESDRLPFQGAFDCNGNGACFDVSHDTVMCPTSKATKDRIHSPKGRAAVLREWLRQMTRAGASTTLRPPPFWMRPFRFVQRLFNTLTGKFGRYDFSHEVYGAMEHCLSCGACTTGCPIKVDIPEYKSRFLSRYHSRYLRPARDGMIARLEGLLPTLARWPRLANLLTTGPVYTATVGWWSGIVDPPRLSAPSLKRQLEDRGGPWATQTSLAQLTEEERARSVILIQDAFTSFYEAPVVIATIDVLEHLGFKVFVAPFLPSGKAAHVKGFTDQFHKAARHLHAQISALNPLGIPMVGLEPAVVLTLRDTYRQIGAGIDIVLLQQFLRRTENQWMPRVSEQNDTPDTYQLLAHCTERAGQVDAVESWQQVFKTFGFDLKAPSVGCCGMCGAYGHERPHVKTSKDIYRLSWESAIRGDTQTQSLATGHSCRSQVKRMDQRSIQHPVEILAQALRQGAS